MVLIDCGLDSMTQLRNIVPTFHQHAFMQLGSSIHLAARGANSRKLFIIKS